MTQPSTTATQGNTLKKLIVSALGNLLIGVIALGVVLFLPAWTLAYWQGWVFDILFMGLVTVTGFYFSIKDPALMERRKQAGPAAEESTGQKIMITFAYISLVGVMVFSAFDHRFGWSLMPAYVSIIGAGLVVLANIIWFYVQKENTFVGATVRIFEGQKVISSGPYALVRHPKYVGDLMLILGIPLALGSWWGLLVLTVSIPGLVWRILDEEILLKKDLPGYAEYMQKVKYRLVPYVW
jgi:protein-S-isoprenylcysteine O-methyltransferase Ste14